MIFPGSSITSGSKASDCGLSNVTNLKLRTGRIKAGRKSDHFPPASAVETRNIDKIHHLERVAAAASNPVYHIVS
jgi:hypothetical protein